MFLAGGYGSNESRQRLRERVHAEEWQSLRTKIAEHGLRHSVVAALMPTASTAQILGNVEAFEALGSNIFVRRTLAGEFTLVNDRLVRDLRALGIWGDDTRHALIRAEGSVQSLPIPDHVKALYRTVWEIPQRTVCQLAADRQPFVDQAQSLNIHMEAPTVQKLSSLHFFNLKQGLKTSSYYVRSRAATSAIKFTIPQEERVVGQGAKQGSSPDGESQCDASACVMCSS
jgi:ribonucleotide reductase alpha subunit